MSGSARWKEDRIRERTYLEQLKHTETLPNGAGFNGANSQGGTPVLFLQQLMMSLSKLEEKDHYNDYDDFVSATSR